MTLIQKILVGIGLTVILSKMTSSSSKTTEVVNLYNKYRGITEDQDKIYDLLKRMWHHVGWEGDKAIRAIKDQTPWSAAFVSYAFRKFDDFPKSASHSYYIVKSRENTKSQEDKFRLRRISEYKPKVGDIVCRNRNGNNYSYDSIYRGAISHCDIVTKVTPTHLVSIGGNVSNQIKTTNVPLKNGFVSKSGYFAIIENLH